MHISGLRPISIMLAVVVAVAALAGYFYFVRGSSEAAGPPAFTPNLGVRFCNGLPNGVPWTTAGIAGNPTCADNSALNTPVDYTTNFSIPGNQENFSNVITVVPPGYTINGGNTSVPYGTMVGGLASTSTLGLNNGPCTSTVNVNFVLFNVPLPNNPGNPRASTNIAEPRAPGTEARYKKWRLDTNGDGVHDYATASDPDLTVSGFDPTVAAGSNIPLSQGYPGFLLDLFDPGFIPPLPGSSTPVATGTPIVPKAVYGGITNAAGLTWTPIFFVVFDKTGSSALSSPNNAGGFAAPHPFSHFPASLGYPSVTILNDPTEVLASPSAITSFCTPLVSTTMLLGNPGGNPRMVSPNPGGAITADTSVSNKGTELFLAWTASYRDLDNDGIENNIDTCPTVANTGTDADLDGIDSACDPNDAVDQGTLCTPNAQPGDADCDGFLNGADNCVFVANSQGTSFVVPPDTNGAPGAYQAESEGNQTYAAAAADGGPKTDHLGDACDSGTANFTQNGVAMSVALSTTVANGVWVASDLVTPKCIGIGSGSVDADGDGWCAATSGEVDSSAARHPILPTSGYQSLTGVDTDGDGYNDYLETAIGTDPTKKCNFSATASNEPLQAWGPDFNDTKNVNLTDVILLKPHFGSSGGLPAYSVRFDLNDDTQVNLTDVILLKPAFGTSCTSTPQQ